LLKGQCLAPWDDFHQYESLCYNDLQPLYTGRNIDDHVFPYVNEHIEYPVLTGLFMWASGFLATGINQYLIVSALLLAPFAFLITYLLAQMTGRRALLWAAAPSLALYAFHNWDLLAVASVVAGFWFWWRDRPAEAAICFGVGGAFKLYPLLFVAPLAFDELARGGLKRGAAAAGVGGGVFAIINLPFVLANFDGWWATYGFHRARGPNFDSIWAIRDFGPISIPFMEPATLNLVTGLLIALFGLVAVVIGWWRYRNEGRFPFVATAAALLAAFLAWNKVHSPQYALWILPFFVMLRVHAGWWVAYTLADLAAYVGVFRFFFDSCTANAGCLMPAEPTAAQELMTAGVFARAGLLVALFVIFLRAPAVIERFPSHPPGTVREDRTTATGTA
jgi:uncharacterized membrane protein